MSRFFFALLVLGIAAGWSAADDEAIPLSEATEACLLCHETLHPGIVEDWRSSRHARITTGAAAQVEGLASRVSSAEIPQALAGVAVGCAECHTLRPDKHADTFDHADYPVHVVVSPDDCAVCHAAETDEYSRNIMSRAHGNLKNNALYQDLERNLLGVPSRADGRLSFGPPDAEIEAQGCLYCHGTRLTRSGTETRETALGEMDFPVIEGWPNQGVGRVNLDGSLGSCSACHTRHGFSIETARKPYTCKECHVGPDVPVFKVYSSSKHGNIFHSVGEQWDFDAVPWTVGEDFTAPTCAACHVSLVVTPDDEIVAERTHQMSDRIAWRIFGLVYSHAHPKNPDTTIIRNKDGLPLPTALDGTPAAEFLIGEEERKRRRARMKAVCLSCHGTSWVEGHFERYEKVHETTNEATLVATRLLLDAWSEGHAGGPAAGASPFDEAVEQMWMDVWLFYANSIRFASAMAGGGDYAVFADGHYAQAKRIKELEQWLELRRRLAAVGGD